MVGIELHSLKAAAYLLLLAAPAAAAPEPAAAPAAAAVQETLLDNIASETATHGAHSATLIPLLMELGHLYRDSGDTAFALAAFEQARGVLRANRGFSSLEEAPMLEQIVSAQEHLGYVQEPWQLEHELLALAAANADDVRAATIYRELGDKRLDMVERYIAGEFPPQMVLGCYYDVPPTEPSFDRLVPLAPNCTAGSRSQAIRAVRQEAWNYYYAAIKILNQHQLYSSPELHAIEARIVRDAYRFGAYSSGRYSLKRKLSYEVANEEPLAKRVSSLLEIADWDIVTTQALGTRNVWRSAIETYEQLSAKLRADGADEKAIDAVFAPEVPVVLPTFAPNPLVAERTASNTHYVEVAFDVTRFGRARRVRLLDSDASRAARGELRTQIVRSVFRPQVIDGRVADAAPVVVRYYVAE